MSIEYEYVSNGRQSPLRIMAGMRFYLDENLSQTVAIIARPLGLDVTSAQELNRRGFDDLEQLRYTTMLGRCLVTVDCRDFQEITFTLLKRGEAHAGVLCVPTTWNQRQYRLIAEALLQYDRDHPEGAAPNLVDYLRRAGA